MSHIELSDIWYAYPDGTMALQGVTAVLEKGKKIAFVGPNGSGKSTLFLLLNGLCRARRGEYRFNGERITHTKAQERMLIENIGLVFQDPDVQLFAPTVFQEISFGPKNLGLPVPEVVRRVNAVMDTADVAGLKDRPVHCLIYGEKKRVAIAAVLAMEPPTVILDEPFAWLDAAHEKKISGILGKLSDEGKTIIISTHNSDLAYAWADTVCVIRGGKFLAVDTPATVFSDRELLAAAGLNVPLVVRIAERLKLGRMPRDEDELLSMIGGGDGDCHSGDA
jgi:cobalt/nickel transport system ATP-binding protein